MWLILCRFRVYFFFSDIKALTFCLKMEAESMGRDLDLAEENLTTVGGEISAEQVSHVVAVDEKLRIHKETALDVCCILLLLEGCLHLNHYLLSQDSMSGILLSSSVLP